MKFPLPPNALPSVTLSEDDEEALEAIAEVIVKKTMSQYLNHLTTHHGVVDETRWKQVKHRDGLRAYHERQAYRRDVNNQHDVATDDTLAMLTFGTVPGNLDDVMYGALNPTTEDMMLKSAYVDDGFVDWAVLVSIIQPTPESSFRELSIKWTVKGHPFLIGTVVRPRDTVYIESIGFAVSPNGERIGYHLQHSVEIPGFHELTEYNTQRVRISFCHLFRQRDANMVEVYVRGSLVRDNGIPISLLAATSAQVSMSVRKNAYHAEMKKLSRVVNDSRTRSPNVMNTSALSYASSSSSSSAASLENSPSSSSAAASSASTCARCYDRIGGHMASLIPSSSSTSSKEKHCHVCHLRICSRCRVYKVLFSRTTRAKELRQVSAAFCTKCVAAVANANSGSFAIEDAFKCRNKQSADAGANSSSRDDRAVCRRSSITSSIESTFEAVDF